MLTPLQRLITSILKCVILNYVNANYMITKYRNTENTVLRDTIHAALGISYIRHEDLEFVVDDMHSIFDSLKKT